MTLCIVGFDDLVTSFVATIATGWSDPCRVGLSPTGKPRLYTAHSAIGVERSLLATSKACSTSIPLNAVAARRQ
jgi:hypothetical protein